MTVSANVLSGLAKAHLAKMPCMFWEAKKPFFFLRQMVPENIDTLFHYLNSTASIWTFKLIFIFLLSPLPERENIKDPSLHFHEQLSQG